MYKKQWLIFYLVLCLVMLVYSYSNAERIEGKVVNVIDGNTLELETKEGSLFILKLWGVDCPELEQPYGEEAKELLEDLLKRKKVTVEVKGKDRKGVRLAEIFLKNGDSVNPMILQNGLGWSETKNYNAVYDSLEAAAKGSQIGLWKDVNPTPPWIFRRQQSMKMAKGS